MDANDVRNFFESVCGEVGYSTASDYKDMCGWMSEDTRAKLQQAEDDGVRDLGDWYADELYSDQGFMRDMIGDHVFGLENECEIVLELAKDSHYRDWALDFLKRHKKRLAGEVGTIMWKEKE